MATQEPSASHHPRSVLIVAADTGRQQAGMRVHALELGIRVARLLTERRIPVAVAFREDDREYELAVTTSGARPVRLQTGGSGPERLLHLAFGLRSEVARASCIYSLNPKLPFGALGRCKTAVTVHDTCFIETPEEFDLTRRLYFHASYRYVLSRADHVFTISEHTRTAVLKRFRVPPERVTVATNGIPAGMSAPSPGPTSESPAEKLGIDRPFFLFLGKLSPRKNLALVIRAVEILRREAHAPYIVLAGPPGWKTNADWSLIRSLGLEQHFRSIGFVDANALLPLMQHCAGLLYPSRCEGFGMPVVEALSAGVPVVVARGTVCEEIGGRFALSVGPDSPEEMADAMRRLLAQPPSRSVSAAVQAHLSQFSWDAAAGRVAAELLGLLAS